MNWQLLNADELILKNLGNEKITPFVQKLDLELTAIEKGGYDHFMLKEIFEQPDTIFDCLRGGWMLQKELSLWRVFKIILKNLSKQKESSSLPAVPAGTRD